LKFPEGPVYLGGGELVVTEIQGQCVTKFADGKSQIVAKTGGGANGATLGRDGAIYVTNNGGLSLGETGYWHAPDPITGRIQRVTLDGEVTDFVSEFPGAEPHRPNDLCFGPDGLLYFTDPHNWEDFQNLGPGRVDRVTAEGKVEQLAEVGMFPNGIAFGPEINGQIHLYVTQTITRKILEFPWSEAGLGEPREFAELPENHFPDGVCFSVDGDLYVSGARGAAVCVFDREGKLKERLDTKHSPSNCCFGDGTLYVTLAGSGELIGFDLGVEGLSLYT
ncbi:MAG: SMP-30/gluconolactonase/LRE family protein, partial [Acidimicrobiia bacterium]